MANSDIKSKRLSGAGAAGVGRARLRQVQVLTSSGGAGRLIFTDGGSPVLDLDFLASDLHSVNIPDEGILFATDIHVGTADNISAITIFYS